VWREQASSLVAAVVGTVDGRSIIPDHKLMLVDCATQGEAFYLSGMLNSGPANFTAISYAVEISFDTHLLQNICVPKFDPKNKIHRDLSALSEEAHSAISSGDDKRVSEIEEEIDLLCAKLWNLSDPELKEIKQSLADLKK
jgi:hypothetical protein